uniref:Glutamine amidotransferase domain-containing protein n=1 Tax=Globisporangium ultimum (strain ATCC 200006 / CBS 805.95 / DAOM BR144) TaxID=431595 RepID=K3WB80_GLOUD
MLTHQLRRASLRTRATRLHVAAGGSSFQLQQLHERALHGGGTTKRVKYLVLDGYIKWGRDDLESGGAVTAGQLYADMLVKCTPPQYNASYDLMFPADPDFELPDLSQYHGVGWSGSSLTVYKSDDERIIQMSDLARRCFEQGIPQFGSCFGAQLAVAVTGGVVQKNKFGKELGIARKISLTDAGRVHPMYEGKPSVFGGFTSHNDQVTHINPGGLKLATNSFTSVQAVSVRYANGDFWAVQYHPEYDLHEIARLLYCRRQVSINLGFFRDMAGADAFIEDLETLHADRSRRDIAWRYGIDDDVLDDDIRTCEVRNFIKHLVLPYQQRKLLA